MLALLLLHWSCGGQSLVPLKTRKLRICFVLQVATFTMARRHLTSYQTATCAQSATHQSAGEQRSWRAPSWHVGILLQPIFLFLVA
jgi:hypothetical protein